MNDKDIHMMDLDGDEELHSPPRPRLPPPAVDMLALLPSDTILHVFSFLYQCASHRSFLTEQDDILSVLAGHNDLATLYATWPAMRPFLQEFAVQTSFLPPLLVSEQQQQQQAHDNQTSCEVPTSCPFAHRLKIIRHADVRTYQCSGETRTGKQGMVNLLHNGRDDWNQWYDPTLRLNDTIPYYAQIWLHKPVRLVAYGMTSAANWPDRDPKDWRLLVSARTPPAIGYYQPYQKFVTAHVVQDHVFVQRHETSWHVMEHILDPVVTIRLAIDATQSPHAAGTQLCQWYLVVLEE